MTICSPGKGRLMIKFDAVNKRFPNGTTAVHDLSLEMPDGGVTVLVGSSGCGKTTTLRMINRMVDPTSGTIRVGGKDVLAAGRGRAAPLHRLRHPAVGPLPAPHDPRQHRDGPAAARLGPQQGPRPRRGTAGDGRPRRRVRQALPAPALRRPAAARRRGPGARRRPAGAADGRALRRGRPGRPHPAPGRTAAAPEGAEQDDRLRHARHRRGRPARRPHRRLPHRRPPRPVREPRRTAGPPGGRLRRGLPGRRARA